MAAIELYKEVNNLTEYQFTQLINYLEREQEQKTKNEQDNLVSEAKRMLKVWGAVNAYSSGCGYKDVSSMFSQLYPKCPPIVIENEVDFIESCFIHKKKSKNAGDIEQVVCADLYYKGVDIVSEGSDWSERLTLRDIAKLKNLSKDTVSRRISAFESYIVAELSRNCY